MNKKKLSVVMAGAMLATSVAPVEMGVSQRKLVEKEVNDLVESGKISQEPGLKKEEYVSEAVKDEMKNTHSIYGLKVLDEKGKEIDLNDYSDTITGTAKLTYNIAAIKEILDEKGKEVPVDYTIQIVERENSKFLGQVIPGSEIVPGSETEADNKYKVDEFKSKESFKTANSLTTGENNFVKDVEVDSELGTAKIILNAEKDLTADKVENITLDVKLGDTKYDFALPLDAKGNLITDATKIQDCVDFHKKVKHKVSKLTLDGETKLVKEYKLVDDEAKEEKVTYLANELYDGLALTAKGTEIKADIDNASEIANENKTPNTVVLDGTNVNAPVSGVYSFTVTYYASHKDVPLSKPSKIVTVKSTNSKEIKALYDLISTGTTDYKVGIVAGDNRYETAVNVSKTNGARLDTNHANIVLVNGESLVDGLAAAPLAASINKTNTSSNDAAPVLLTYADKLAPATKKFIEGLADGLSKADRANYTVNLVGGESVLTKELVKEIKEMGFSVVRYGGDNREETSLEVANKVASSANHDNNVFVVGGNGEADAMSIASEAASKKTPIVVAKNTELSKEGIRFIKDKSVNGNVAVIGGESVVSKASYDKIDEVTKNKVERVSGLNRFETNAAIIEKYAADGFEEVILVKDGQAKKNELVDALSAANLAAGNPIVLSTGSLKESQKIAIIKKKADNMKKLTQVGQGVERPTLEAVAEFLGLSNLK